MTNKHEGTVLVVAKHGRGNVRIPVAKFNAENEAAHEAGTELPWTKADDAPEYKTFEDLSKAEQKQVKERQAARQAFIDGEGPNPDAAE